MLCPKAFNCTIVVAVNVLLYSKIYWTEKYFDFYQHSLLCMDNSLALEYVFKYLHIYYIGF